MSLPSDPRRPTSLAACALVVAALGATADASAGEISEASAVDQISRYCSTSWRNAGIGSNEWPDCTQEAFAELLSRVSRAGLRVAIENPGSDERRELNRSIWCTIQRWRRARRPGSLDGFDVDDPRTDDPVEALAADDLRELVDEARLDLSPRQSRILGEWLDGHSVGEIAERLNIAPARVSDEKYKAIRQLRRGLGQLRVA